MRKIQITVLSAFALAFAANGFAQTRTVTNADLEKFREKRLRAEQDLRENYEALGFPSPEELERREAESRRERAALDRRLREEERRQNAGSGAYYYQTAPATPVYPYPNPSFVDYGGRYAPGYLYYRFYYPRSGYPVRPVHREPRRFQTFRRQWRNAVRDRRND